MADNKVLARNSPNKTAAGGQNGDTDDEEEEIFEVEKIIGKSKLKGKVIYKVRWKGFGPADDTWEPADNLDACQDLIEEYVGRQSEAARKRAEERRMKRAHTEGKDQRQSTTDDPDSDSPYPPNFKNSFWKDLEAGRVNLFDNDMYSKVKNRAVTQPTPDSPTSSGTEQTAQPKKRTQSDPQTSETEPVKLETKSKSTSKLKSDSAKPDPKHSASSRKIDFKRGTDSEKKANTEEQSQSSEKTDVTMVTDSSDSEAELKKPALNIVIRKVPSFADSTDGGCSEDSESVKYSVVQRSPEEVTRKDNATVCGTGEPDRHDDGDSHLIKRDKKKKQHKHHKHKSKHGGSRSEHRVDSDRKRKVDKTSLSNLDACTSKGTSQKVPKLEPGTFSSTARDLDTTDTDTTVKTKSADPVVEVKTERLMSLGDDVFCSASRTTEDIIPQTGSELSSETQTNSKIDSQIVVKTENVETAVTSSFVSAIQEDIASVSSASPAPSTSSSSSSSSSPTRSIDSASVNSPWASCLNDLSMIDNSDTHRSHPAHLHIPPSNTSRLSDNTNIQPNLNSGSGVVNPNPNIGQVGLEPGPTIKADIHRQDSETVDSGIASPASDKSLTISRQGLMQPLDDLFGQTVLPLLPDNDQTQARGADHELGIDLDEMDWDLFDKDVKLETITLTNSEFAKAVIMGDYELVKQSVMGDGKYDLEQPDSAGKTLLMCAVHSMYDDIAELLLDHGANIDARTKTDVTALMIACQHGEIGMVNMLLERGAKVNPQCATGESALIISHKRGHGQIVWLLLECGANFNQMSPTTGRPVLSELQSLPYREPDGILARHIHRVMSEFDRQVRVTFNNAAQALNPIFPAQIFNLCEAEKFDVKFDYSLHQHVPGSGYLLFVGHAIFSSQEVRVRFYGPCAVQAAILNGQLLSPLTQEGNFVLTFSPLVPGKNVLTLNTVRVPEGKAKLIVCAYKSQLLGHR